MKRSVGILILVALCFGLGSCDGTSGGPTDTSNYGPAVLFAETWQSYSIGNFPGGGWKDHPQPYYHKKVTSPVNDHKMLMDGPSGPGDLDIGSPDDVIGGIYFNFKKGTMKPTFIRYRMHPYSHDPDPGDAYSSIGHFSVQGFVNESMIYNTATTGVHIYFKQYENSEGTITANSYQYGETGGNPLNIDNSFLIELRNIHWETYPKTFDLWINGIEVETCIPFLKQIESITRIYFFNNDYGRFHMDDIFMADLPYRNTCVVLDEPAYPDTMPIPPPPSPTFTREPIIFILRTPAFCRLGPGTDYPKLTTFPEDTQLIINGQNLEGTWWWSADANCWISDAVGEVQGNPRFLEVIIPPPPPEPDTSDGDPGKPGGCHSGMGQSACEASGGQWSPPGQPDQCVCP
jgi:hypothetical protein